MSDKASSAALRGRAQAKRRLAPSPARLVQGNDVFCAENAGRDGVDRKRTGRTVAVGAAPRHTSAPREPPRLAHCQHEKIFLRQAGVRASYASDRGGSSSGSSVSSKVPQCTPSERLAPRSRWILTASAALTCWLAMNQRGS